jgi:hypothetical protein
MSDAATIYYRIRDLTYAGGLTVLMLINIYHTTAYQIRKFQTHKNLYSIFSSHFFLHLFLIFYALLTLTRYVLFHSVTVLPSIQPFLTSSLFTLDGFIMTIFLIVIWTYNKEFFKTDIHSCSKTSGILFTKIFFVQLLTVSISIACYFVNLTPEVDKYLNLGFGIYFVFFFFVCAGF